MSCPIILNAFSLYHFKSVPSSQRSSLNRNLDTLLLVYELEIDNTAPLQEPSWPQPAENPQLKPFSGLRSDCLPCHLILYPLVWVLPPLPEMLLIFLVEERYAWTEKRSQVTGFTLLSVCCLLAFLPGSHTPEGALPASQYPDRTLGKHCTTEAQG